MVIGKSSGANNDSINDLDGGNPLHMNPNDSTSISLIPFKLLGTKNYRIWASVMKLALQARNKFAFVDGSCVKTAYSTSEVLFAQWDRCNDVVLTWIMNYVFIDVYMVLAYSVDATSVWKDIESTYNKVDGSIIVNLELDTHNKLMKLMQFLMGLDECYLSVRISLLTRDPLSEVKDAYLTVSREKSHRGIPESSSVTEAKLNAASFAAKSSNNFKRSNNNGNKNTSYTRSNNAGNVNRGPNPNLSCKNCGMIGYTIKRYYELIGLGHPTNQVLVVLKEDLKLSKTLDVFACEAAYLCLE
nr:hypothetical protein [Tanacetum cinerariifolium]